MSELDGVGYWVKQVMGPASPIYGRSIPYWVVHYGTAREMEKISTREYGQHRSPYKWFTSRGTAAGAAKAWAERIALPPELVREWPSGQVLE